MSAVLGAGVPTFIAGRLVGHPPLGGLGFVLPLDRGPVIPVGLTGLAGTLPFGLLAPRGQLVVGQGLQQRRVVLPLDPLPRVRDALSERQRLVSAGTAAWCDNRCRLRPGLLAVAVRAIGGRGIATLASKLRS
jgi:hypothetical protein